jgi:hypothetical protein
MWEQGDVLVTPTLARRAAGRRADRGPPAGEELPSSLVVLLEAARLWADRRALAAARAPAARQAAKTASVAVKPCTKLRSPTGPISPAQKKPAAGALENARSISDAS